MATIQEEMVKEAAERWMELTLTKSINNSRASRRGVVATVAGMYTDALDPSGTFMTEGRAKATSMGARAVADFGPVMAASAASAILSKASFWDKVLPGDNSSLVVSIKKWARMIAPGLVLGAGEAISDAVTRLMTGHTAQIQAEAVGIDDLVWWHQMPGVVFVPQRDSDGLIQYRDPVTQCFPVVLSAIPDSPHSVTQYYREADAWLSANLTAQQGQQGQQQGRRGQQGQQGQQRNPVAPTRPIVFIKRTDIPRLVQAGITPAQLDTLLNMFKEKEWWETVGPAVRQFG
ncbi:MAG: hypothetical protein AAB431_00055, partial [Patescibacteria group bacterium]